MKWLAGDRTEADFINAGNEIDLETMAFTVEENDTYTIYALNAKGAAALSTIKISNIVAPKPESEPAPEPVPDPNPELEPKGFEVNLDLDLTEETEDPVTIKITTTSEAEITALKWLAGDRTETDFINAGNEIDLKTMAFTVEENNIYTIYALNAEGAAALSTIKVSNIVAPKPESEPAPEPEPKPDSDPELEPKRFEMNLDIDFTEETEGPVTIKITTTSEADIMSLKWLAGDRTEADFMNAGNEIDLETMAFTVEENNIYTIYALNAEGAAALSTIEVSNIVAPELAPNPESGDSTDSEEGTDSDDSGQRLPSTATNLYNLLIIGGVMLVLGLVLMIFRRKQTF